MKRFIVLALVVAGCASGHEHFIPTEGELAEGTKGEPAAGYDVRGPAGQVAQVNVWSENAHWAKLAPSGPKTTVVDVGIEVRNTSNAPISLDPTKVELQQLQTDKGAVMSAPMIALEPSATTVPPGDIRDFTATFELPQGVKPTHLDQFRVRWAIMANGVSHTRFTAFRERPSDYYSYYEPMWGYYDAWYDPWYSPTYHAVVIPHHRFYY